MDNFFIWGNFVFLGLDAFLTLGDLGDLGDLCGSRTESDDSIIFGEIMNGIVSGDIVFGDIVSGDIVFDDIVFPNGESTGDDSNEGIELE